MNYFHRNILLAIFLVILLQSKLFAQSYVPFPEGEAVWHVAEKDQYAVVAAHRQFMYTGDTTFNGFLYHRLSYKYESVHLPDGNLVVTDYGAIGFVRQDSLARKVYYFPKDEPDEYLLYDFGLQVGDFYPKTYTHYSDNLALTKIDSILIDNSFRRVFVFDFPQNYPEDTAVRLIEGIGNDAGLLTYAEQGNCFETCIKLACFQQDGETVYAPDEFAFGYYPFGFCHIVGVSEIENQRNDFLLYPNLVVKGDECTLINNIGKKMEVLVSNLFGNVIWRQKFNSESPAKIPTGNLPGGIYLVKILIDNKFLSTQKLVVQ